MIDNKEKLKQTLHIEFNNYFKNKRQYLKSFLLGGRYYNIWQYQRNLRILEYYKNFNGGGKMVWLYKKLMFAYYSRKVNKLGTKLGIETWCNVFDEGLLIYHFAGGLVVSSNAQVGKNCHLHGNNCIGNNGSGLEVPVIGDNCVLGVGAKIIGNVRLGNNIKVAAGAVVVKSFIDNNVTLAGIPAEIVKRQ